MFKKWLAIFAALMMFAGACLAEEPTPPPMESELFLNFEEVFAYYEQVTFEDTLESLTERLGAPETLSSDNGEYHTWSLEGGLGVTAIFFDDGTLRAKIVQFEDIRQFAALSKASYIENAQLLNSGMAYDLVKNAFGVEGIEIMRMIGESGSENEQYLMLWVSEEGGVAEGLFDGKTHELVQAAYSLGE